ncbi:MAG: glycosyltransferase [Casimicrobiaceae bacterium]
MVARTADRPASVRVLHIITGLNTGGAETALCRLLETLRPPAFEHVVVALGPPGTLSARVGAAAEPHHLGMTPSRLRPRDLWRLRRIVRAFAPSVVHGWMYHANIAATLATMGLGVPVLWGIRQSLHGLEKEKRATRMIISGGALLSRRPRQILYNSDVSAGQHEAAGYDATRTRVIPNGFNTDLFRPDQAARLRLREELALSADALLIGLVARVHPIKDHANFLRAAALFAANYPQAHFVLVGDGAEVGNNELTGLIEALQLPSCVHLLGRRTDIAAIAAALDIASSSSWGEAFPNAIGEAMACAVPCVATDVGDVPQIIGDTGVVVPARDATALAAGWGKLAWLDPSSRQALGLRARQRIIARYSLPTVTAQYAELYASLIRQTNNHLD